MWERTVTYFRYL